MYYIENGWDKDLIDPDKGKNIDRKEKLLRPSVWFPDSSENWTNLTVKEESLPNFSLSNVTNYFVNRQLMDGLPANDFKSINKKSYELFKAGHIQYVKVLQKDSSKDKVYIKCACLPEMRKNMEYTVNLIVNRKDGEIEFARCGCPAGKGPHGSCKHIAALCYCLVEYVNVGTVRNHETCTSKLQTWNQPRSKQLPGMLVRDINFLKPKPRKGSSKTNSSKCRAPRDVKSVFDHLSTPSKYQRSSSEANATLRSLCIKYKLNSCFLHCLRENTGGDGSSPGKETVNFTVNNVDPNIIVHQVSTNLNSKSNNVNSEVINHVNSNTNDTMTNGIINDVTDSATTDILMGNQTETPTKMSSQNQTQMSTQSVSRRLIMADNGNCFTSKRCHVTGNKTLTLLEFKETAKDCKPKLDYNSEMFYSTKVKVNCQQAFQLEASTRDQGNSTLWHSARSVRLTSSHFGDVICRKKTDVTKLVDSMLNLKDISHLPAVTAGREMEDTVANYYKIHKNRNECPGTEIYCSGLVVNPQYPWLGASPDRIVYDPTSNPCIGGLECKFISSAKGLSPMQVYHAKKQNKKSFCLELEGCLSLKTTHKYYYQIQGQCAIANFSWVDLAVMTDPLLHDNGFFTQRIYFNQSKWKSEWLPKLTDFYFIHLLPKMLHIK